MALKTNIEKNTSGKKNPEKRIWKKNLEKSNGLKNAWCFLSVFFLSIFFLRERAVKIAEGFSLHVVKSVVSFSLSF